MSSTLPSPTLFELPSTQEDMTERDRELLKLRAASPLRSITQQSGLDGLALFDQHRSPKLI